MIESTTTTTTTTTTTRALVRVRSLWLSLSVGTSFFRAVAGLMATSSMPLGLDGIHQGLQHQHDQEIHRGFEKFGPRSPRGIPQPLTTDSAVTSSWADEDFDVFSVGIQNAGPNPTEVSIRNGHKIFRTKSPVLSSTQCQALIDEASEVINNGKGREQNQTPNSNDGRGLTNSQLNEAKLSDLPRGNVWIRDELLRNELFPMLENRFGVDADGLTLNDALIIGYIGPSRSQPIHRDASLLSLQIALSPVEDYRGGGTYFEGMAFGLADESASGILKMKQGHVLCHSSGAMHAGRGVETGQRWILVLFVLSQQEPQFARRCHAEGIIAMDEKKLELAEQYYRAGLQVAPDDHLLHIALSKCYFQQGPALYQKARTELEAAKTYECCSKSHIAHANVLLSKNRHRAALRQLDTALKRIGEKDWCPEAWTPLRAMAWDARVQAGRCACLCAEYVLDQDLDRNWTLNQLPVAKERMKLALKAAPGHQPLQAMLERADYLLQEAKLYSFER